MIVLAIANGTLRQGVFLKHMSDNRAHQLSTLTLMVLCAVYVWMVFPVLQITSGRQALIVGLVWAVLTVMFEFTFGLLAGRSLAMLLEDYNLAAGRVWPVFLASLALLPYAVYSMRK